MPSSLLLVTNLAEAHRGARVGSKAANLSRLIAARFAVPRGFVISADAYRSHLWATGLREAAATNPEAEQREDIRAAILSRDIPQDVWSSITVAYERLSWQSGVPEPVVAVRSSALEDNGLRAGFSSAYESHLGVSGIDNLQAAIKRVWASLWNGRAAGYRAAHGCTGEPAMAVIIQEMVSGPSGGSASSADMFTGNPNVVQVTIERGGAVAHHEANLAAGSRPEDELVARIVDSAVLIQDTMGQPVEIEWLHDGERLWLLQATPIDGLPVHFPAEQVDQTGSTRTRWTQSPVCTFSRSHLWSHSRPAEYVFTNEEDLGESRLVNGYLYRRRASLVGPKSGNEALRRQKRDTAAGLSLLPKWRDQALPAIRKRASSVVSTELTNLDHRILLGLLKDAADLSRSASDLLEATWYPSERFALLLRALIGDNPEANAAYLRLSVASAESIQFDAALQELAERLAIAERSGRLVDPVWWRSYKREVDLLATRQGFAYENTDEAVDISIWRSWIEDRDALFRVIGALSRRGDDPSLITRHCARERDAALVLDDCSGLKPAAAKLIKDVAVLAQGWRAVRFEAAQVSALASSALRLVLNELACRLCTCGVLSSADSIYHLELDELLSLPSDPTPSDREATAVKIASRKHALWLEQRLTAPETLPVVDAPLGESSHPAAKLTGECICPGAVTARARVCHTAAEAGDLERGEILVVKCPMPAWTPFLGLAGGFVAVEPDEIGIQPLVLDYGIPAMANCTEAISRVSTGQRITLDATNSIVHLSSVR